MKKSLVILFAALACTATSAFADNKQVQGDTASKKQHELIVGNQKAVDSGSNTEDKTVKQVKNQAGHKHEKGDHEMAVGNEKAAGSGSVAENKIIKDEKTHTNKGKHKSKGHNKE